MKSMKVNIPCGTKKEYKFPHPWVNIDSQPGCADIIADAQKLPDTFLGNIEELYVSHLLEHFSMEELNSVLLYWKSLLKPGGVLRIVVPDAKIVAQAILDEYDSKGRKSISAIETTPILTQIFGLGYKKRNMNKYMRHHFLFDKASLIELLEYTGFESVFEYSRDEDPSIKFGFNNDASGPFSLFVKAYKPR